MHNTTTIHEKLKSLAPWHFDIELPSGIRTSEGNIQDYTNPDFKKVHTIDPNEMEKDILSIYPEGLNGKTFLDVGCNAGGYCFLASKLGAKYCLGFDVRDHWINQANFIKEQFGISSDKIDFKTTHLNQIKDKKFDVTLYKGVLYHVPNPIESLVQLADMTNDVLIVDSASKTNSTPNSFTINFESVTHVMSGVDKLAWLPSGPDVVKEILQWKGFTKFQIPYWHKENVINSNWGRFRIIAQR